MTTEWTEAPAPSGTGCAECEEAAGWWLHLRRCTTCGHVGCCDASPNQHARRHFEATGHAVMRSFEPDEEWFWDFQLAVPAAPVPLPPPLHRPVDQPSPGPEGRVPPDWRRRLNRA